MVFSSVVFLSLFLPVFLILYNISGKENIRNIILLVFSLFFYAWGEPVWILALIFSGTIDYIHGIIINKWFGKWQAKAALLSSLFLNLGILILFKYSGFFVETINSVLGTRFNIPSFSLPLGISFYTFQTLSYTIDVYLGGTKYQKSYVAFMAYVSMFPQLVAGPIVRYSDIAPSLDRRVVTVNNFSRGVTRFAIGLSKKVLLANNAGKVVTLLLDGRLTGISTASAWLGLIMYAFQIYFDFSGYSDMAIGLGKMIGFNFKENFNYPYIAVTVTDFWRRWHISLSSFFRDYVYIPLGGNRKNLIRNILIVWFLTGFWHGASWNFILWGLYYGVLLLVEKKLLGGALKKINVFAAHLYSLFFILLGWSIFYFTDMGRLSEFLKSAFHYNSSLIDYTFLSTLYSNIFLIIALAIASTPLPSKIFGALRKSGGAFGFAEPVLALSGVLVSFIVLLGQTYNPFLYFRF